MLASGAAALLFETLWFRLVALVLGSGVWASSVVLAGFMVGLAIGNGVAARYAAGWKRPMRAYAGLELTVAALGLLVVWTIPALTRLVAPLLGGALQDPLALNALRFGVALCLLAAPAAAMGATLPTLVRVLASDAESFGSLLGRLYGWNTAGAVIGALLGELVLIERLGLRGTALVASALDVFAALAGLALARGMAPAPAPLPAQSAPLSRGSLRILFAGALAGGALLALEVVWFRFLALRVLGTALVFAVILAVVLAGIALGGVLAGRWCARDPEAPAMAAPLACLAGAALVASFACFSAPSGRYLSRLPDIVAPAALLMLPTCVLSGMLFVLIGARLQAELRADARAAGLLTLANTLGAAAGALLAGFLLLPRIGVGGSLLALAVLYAATAALLGAPPGRRRVTLLAAVPLALAVLLFPRGLVERSARANAQRFAGDGSRLLALREGRLETLVYLRREAWGEPYYDWLLTNGFSMAGTNPGSQRYMKLFAYWPLALQPEAKRALLVCFGVGNTASALVHAPGLESIDVVDLSPDVLEMSALLYPAERHPLRDPRVRVHVEDGRFFLQTTAQRFDLITAEPPPPKNAGVVNLYSREYFALVRQRLNPGGIATHWLPVYQLSAGDARSVVAAFCSVFEDCSLWSGRGLEFMLAGTNGLGSGPSEEAFARLWRAPKSAADLEDVGLESPELLSATFLGDAAFLRELTAGTPLLDDDHPLRLSAQPQYTVDPLFQRLLDAEGARERFAQSGWIRRIWPAGLRERSLGAFWIQAIGNRMFGGQQAGRLADLRRLLQETPFRALPLLLLESSPAELRLAEAAGVRHDPDPLVAYVRGLGALAARDFSRADSLLDEAERRGAPVTDLPAARAFVREFQGMVPGK